uniref:hypothetical protein n=1 Tax=Streptobacillus moniliformis TaxID=34105 RepID=UPI0018C8A9AF
SMNCDSCEVPKNPFSAADTGRMLISVCGVIASMSYLRQMYNPTRPEPFAARVDWLSMFSAAGVPPVEQLIDAQPTYATELADLLGEERLPQWRAWARWQVLSALS